MPEITEFWVFFEDLRIWVQDGCGIIVSKKFDDGCDSIRLVNVMICMS